METIMTPENLNYGQSVRGEAVNFLAAKSHTEA